MTEPQIVEMAAENWATAMACLIFALVIVIFVACMPEEPPHEDDPADRR
jgi:hypothetical protein